MKARRSYGPSKQTEFARVIGDLGRVLWINRDALAEQDRNMVIAQVNQLFDMRTCG